MAQGTNAYMVANLLEKMSNEDRDFRYMALNDLMNELQKDSFQMEFTIENKVVKAVLQLMDDKNGEVQNLAVKCLGPLVKQINETNLLEVIECLSQYASQQKNEELRGIAGIGIKTVVTEVDASKGHQMAQQVVPRLLSTIQKNDASYEMQMDTLDALSEVLSRFGHQVSTEQQIQIQSVLLPLLSYHRAAVRKRVTMAIGYLVVHTNDELFDQIYHSLYDSLTTDQKVKSEKTRTLVQCAGVLSRSSAVRLGNHLAQLVPVIMNYASKADGDDELREICLQTLESFLLRCPNEMTGFVQDIISLSLDYIKYDPNFVDDEDDDDEGQEDMDLEEDENEEEEDEFDDIADYSDDDDDMSWKVRRSASRVLCAIIESRPDLLQALYETVAPVLINRFKEREESVRVDILQSFIALLRQTGHYKDRRQFSSSLDNEIFSNPSLTPPIPTGPLQLLNAQVPKLCRAIVKQLSPKSTQTRQIGFQLLSEVILVLHGGLEEQIKSFIPAIESSLATTAIDQHHTSSSNLKIEVLYFLRLFLHHHPANTIHPYINSLAPAVIRSVSDKFYKITSEAFLVCIELIKVIRPVYRHDGQFEIAKIQPEFVQWIESIYQATVDILNTSDADQEVKERSIMCLGSLLAQVGDILSVQQPEAWDLLLERLRNEVTRLITVRTLTTVSQSPVAAGEALARCVLVAINDVSLLLRKSNRPLRIACLECLTILVNQFGKTMSAQQFHTILLELKPLMTDNDLHLLPLALKTVESILKASPSSVGDVKSLIIPELFKLIESPLLQGSALESLLNMFAAFVQARPSDYSLLVKDLVDPLLHVHTSGVSAGGVAAVANKQAASTVAQSVAVLTAHASPENRDRTIREFKSYLQQPSTNDSIKYLSLLAIGEMGRRIDLSQIENIEQEIIALFSAQSEEVKFAAAFALGNISVGNIHTYLPLILVQIKQEPKRRYLLLHALKEVITRYDTVNQDNSLQSASDEIWSLLLESSESDQEEGTRTVVAECLGKLALTNHAKFMPQLEERLSSSSAYVKATVATAIKYAVVDPSEDVDELLKPIMAQFLSLLQDNDLNVRRLALLTINSAAHRKPHLIRDIIPDLIPLLYAETVVKEELIHTVEMGPFKHKVDDGLEIRKAAFECMYTLLSTCLDKINVYDFLDRVCAGLDDQHDIKMLACLTLIRLSKVRPTAVTQKLDNLVTPFKTTLDFKMRSNAVKQEIEKNQELVRAVLRCIVALHPLSDPKTSPRFEHLELEVSTGPLSSEFKFAVSEAESRESRAVDSMEH
ncbi:Cullin-associated NEDD8-dissociated protein 1 [Choanephora cucurbitarum]|uniref:Cullin-associated NEDD8-dissociated protein 1 n=1 Tax=Choanephora cucurbitarum TaxID=101091 RepID=A0A1C7N9W4_9FUNG|nr:Cullin-associated NEDD8-dissociated protein 1 [Choanephora cucurbitarum]